MPEVLFRVTGACSKHYVCRTANSPVSRILDTSLEGAETDYEVPNFYYFVSFEALLRDCDVVVDQFSRNCSLFLSDRKNRRRATRCLVADLFKCCGPRCCGPLFLLKLRETERWQWDSGLLLVSSSTSRLPTVHMRLTPKFPVLWRACAAVVRGPPPASARARSGPS